MSNEIEMNIKIRLAIPRFPNFLRTSDKGKTIDIGELDGESFDKFLNTYNDKFIEHYDKRRKEYLKGNGRG